jgi:hypothetical protein
MTGWEYTVFGLLPSQSEHEDQEALNEVGEEGWELVSVIQQNDGSRVVYLKRPVPENPGSGG